MDFVNPATNEGYGIGKLPGRRQIALYAIKNGGSSIDPIAYIRERDEAEKFTQWLENLVGQQ